MKKRVEKYIPRAIELLKKVEYSEGNKDYKIVNNRDEVDNKFSGYFSAFGAAIIMSGVKPALAFYSNVKTVKERALILSAIYVLINEENSDKWNDNKIKGVKPKDLLTYYIQYENAPMLKQKILDAATALKLSVRTYKLVKNN